MDQMHMAIRELVPGDEGLVNEFFDQMGGESRAFFNRGDGNRRWAMRYLNGEEKHMKAFAATVPDGAGEKMAGYIFLWDLHTSVPWLGIAVREDCKGKHLGRTLLQHLIDYAKGHGHGGLLLTTAVANLRGQGLYTRMGFEHLGQHRSGEYLYLKRFEGRED